MPKKKAPQRNPMAVRLTAEMDRRLGEVAARTKLSKHSLAIEAIEAAVEAIEANGYRLVVPIQFDVTHVAVGKVAAPAPEPRTPGALAGGRSTATTEKRPVRYSQSERRGARVTTDAPDDPHGAQ